MQSTQHFLKQLLVMYMTLFLAFSPFTAYGAALTPDGTTQTTVGQAGNGVPVVNIANSNATGLSHNRFIQYNVNANGLILNNATRPTATTQLGGVIGGNGHLTAPAKVILNEVTSTNRSSLNGYTEVAGPRADLVIANPNGLTINGAGFINTGRVTLTTGKPVVTGGAIQSLNVTGGDIAIQGTGLNTQGQTSTSIYTQYLNLNAKLHAQSLDVKLGGNSVNYATGAATANGAANARTVLLDSTALGGMYANRITLVGTDAGLGVNLPPEVLASAGDITINNDGTIVLQKVSATNNVNITSANGIDLNNNLYAGSNANLTAGTTMNVSAAGIAAAKNVVTINAAQLTNAGTMIAGLNANQTQNTTGLMNITATTLSNTGDIQSTGNLLASGTTFTNDGLFNAGNDLTLSSTNLTTNKTLFASNNMNLYTTGTLSNTAGSNIFAINNLDMSANAAGGKTASIINTQADIQALNSTLNVNALSLQNITAAPTIGVTNSTAGTTQITTDFLQSRAKEAQLLSGGNINLNADTILNQYSLISAGGNINITSNSLTNQFVNLNEVTLTPTLQSYIFYTTCGWLGQGSCANTGYRTVNVPTTKVIGTVSSTMQAAGNITGNVTNLTSVAINANQVINAAPTAFQQSLPANNRLAVSLPVGTQGLFVVSTNPQSSFLIVTNPKFAIFGNFISSTFLLNNLNFSSDRSFKRLGDAFYETQLIRDSIFSQTGRRFLNSNITSDTAQYQYLMDNALAAQEDLQLIPGISLTHAQITALESDIVWLEEQEVAGQIVLVPVMYLANADSYKVEGGAIVAGNDINLVVDQLNNAGLMEAGDNFTLQASDSIINQKGVIRAGNDLSLTAQNDIKNISAQMRAKNITLVASNGNIINQRQTRTVTSRDADGYDTQTMVGLAGSIQTENTLSLNAGESITIAGSNLKAKDVSLAAKEVKITTTVNNFDSFAGSHGSYIKEQSTTHIASNIEGGNIAINTTGKTTVRGSNIKAVENLNIRAGELEIAAVNNSSYRESKVVKKGLLSKSETTTKHATSTNIASNINGANVSLTATQGDVAVTGSNIHAQDKLALNSAKNIDVQAGFDGTLDETHSKKSGLFTGGKLFSKSEDLEGKLNKTAALANLSGKNISLHAGKDLAFKGVNVSASQSLDGTAKNITVENVNNEEKTYSKHSKMSVGLGDIAKTLFNPLSAANVKDGKTSITLATAEFSKAEKVTTKTEVVSSNLDAGNINLVADNQGAGDITVKGSNLTAKNDVSLTADNNVNIIEAKNTEKTASKDMKGKAELKLTAKNEYVQIAYAVQAVKKAKDNLKKSKHDYDQYKRDLGKQRGKLIKLKADLANGKVGIDQADIENFSSLIDDLKADDAYYKANIALAAADLATKTLAVASQMSTAASSSGTYGFSASLELDIDALEKKFQAYKEQSVASNINAKNINIAANHTATVRGSNLKASDAIAIQAKDTNILASQDVNNSNNSKKHAHLNISYGTSGGSVSASADSAKGSSRGITNTNSQLVASNIHINTHETTSINGANISASDKLNIESKNLDIASVQDSNNSHSNSKSLSVSASLSGDISGVGANMGMSHSREKQTVLTTLNGNQVNINTKENTTLRGATVAAVDNQGNDNGNLKLKTGTLEVSSLNNTRNSKSLSAGINIGISNQKQQDGKNNSTMNSVGIDFANDRSNSKTKTLGTIGNGNIEVASVDKSNTKLLNRDINDNTVDIYNIQSDKGLKGTVDTRMFTKKGRAEIKKEFKDFGKNMQIVAKGLPEATHENKIIAVVGTTLDMISKYTLGIIPSNKENGGLLANIPVFLEGDINTKSLKIVSKDSMYRQKDNLNYIPIEESQYYKATDKDSQKDLQGRNLFISKKPITITKDTATYQNATNGMMTHEAGAIISSINQTHDSKKGDKNIAVTVNYNPTHGFLGDLIEVMIDQFGGTSGFAKQTGEVTRDVTTARGKDGSNFVNYSAGNPAFKQGMEYIKGKGDYKHGGFKARDYFVDKSKQKEADRNAGIPTVAGFGSPVNTKDMEKTVQGDKRNLFDFRGNVTKPNDFVGEGLGGNKGKNQQMPTKDRIFTIINAPKLFTDQSPHSRGNYHCEDNPNAKCGSKP